MRQTSFLYALVSLALWMVVDAFPESPKKNRLPDSSLNESARDDAVQLMGLPEPGNCQNTRNSWSSGTSLWGKLPVASNLALFQNVYNSGQLGAGSKNIITCRSFSDGVVSFKINFQMNSLPNDKNNVKSYSNMGLFGKPQRIGDLKSFGSTWSWNLLGASSDLIADISYDIFLGNDGKCVEQNCASTEIMIWLAAIGGAGPASLTGKSVGTIEVIGRGGSYQFDVWKGVVQNKPVISLIPTNGKKYNSFKANFRDLFVKLGKYGVRQDQYVTSVAAGVEVFRGSGTLDTSAYTVHMKNRPKQS